NYIWECSCLSGVVDLPVLHQQLSFIVHAAYYAYYGLHPQTAQVGNLLAGQFLLIGSNSMLVFTGLMVAEKMEGRNGPFNCAI
ncbi:MAG TPA: hypothetical protein VLL95_12445, partial [Phnomibacter sp.]|nr:hypothetical protein [Phnomibacter sp.]